MLTLHRPDLFRFLINLNAYCLGSADVSELVFQMPRETLRVKKKIQNRDEGGSEMDLEPCSLLAPPENKTRDQ